MGLLDYPGLILVVSFAALWFADWLGARLRIRRKSIAEEERPDFDVVLGAALTLLGLVIGFSFSMAINRFELRGDYEEAEANAIETAYMRAACASGRFCSNTRTAAAVHGYSDSVLCEWAQGVGEDCGGDGTGAA